MASNIGTQLEANFSTTVNAHGRGCTFQNTTISFTASDYDENSSRSASGPVFAGSVIITTLDSRGEDAHFLEQGVLTSSDRKIFAPSGLTIAAQGNLVLSGIGSFYILDNGLRTYELDGVLIYRRAFIRSVQP